VPAVYGDYVFPWWADLIGWMMSFVVAACVPVYAVYALCCLHSGSFLQVRLHSEVEVYRHFRWNSVGMKMISRNSGRKIGIETATRECERI